MPSNRHRLERRIRELVEASALLREKLQQYETTMNKIAGRLEKGEPGITAAKGTGIPSDRRLVTEAIDNFEAARHELRLALMALGREEGASISEVGRVFGISRQLAARLAGEVAETDS